MTTYYIDPSSGTNGNGLTEATPTNTWVGLTWVSGNTYLQKAGTTYTSPPNIGTNTITIGKYGTGNRPKFAITGSFWSITGTNITFKDFELTGADGGILVSGTGFLGDNLDIHDCQGATGYGISFNTGVTATLQNSSVYNIGNDAIEVRAGAGIITIDNCDSWNVSTNSNGGDNIGGSNGGTYSLWVKNSRLTKTDAFKQNIMSGTSGFVKVHNCVIKNFGGGGTVSCQGASLYELLGNDIYGNGANSAPYANGATGTTITNAHIVGNKIILDNNTTYGLQADSNNSGIVNIYNNLIYKSGTTGPNINVSVDSNGTINMKNNIIVGGQYLVYHQGAAALNADYNIYGASGTYVYGGAIKSSFSSWKASASGLDTNSLQTDPLFGANYAPTVGSPCLSTGVKWWTNARPFDVNGEPYPNIDIDIGAIQSTTNSFHPSNIK